MRDHGLDTHQTIQDGATNNVVRVVQRSRAGDRSALRLSNGQTIHARRFVPVGEGDQLRLGDGTTEVFAKHDAAWVMVDSPWSSTAKIEIGSEKVDVTFKEIESSEELEKFESLRRFHYRGGGGPGRAVPLIATCDVWDLPSVLGFIEITSSMIANTARKRFFDHPFFESHALSWQTWDTAASKRLSATIARISRFVIHPELRGLGLAKHFLNSAKSFAEERWHYGGWRPRFIEITADMLRYYRFVGADFAYMGETEGNEHRLGKDMAYLVKKALSEGSGMPQGGGGIMTLQRGYASRLLNYLGQSGKGVPEVVRSLQHNPAALDQHTWEALHRLNRKPKLSFVAGLTPSANKYIGLRSTTLNQASPLAESRPATPQTWSLQGIRVRAVTQISQSSEARTLQDAFGFVGSELASELIDDLSISVAPGEISLICGASGAGKSLLLAACKRLFDADPATPEIHGVEIEGTASTKLRVATLGTLLQDRTPLEMKGRTSLDAFLETTAKCGLAEPQLFVRPISSLSSGQKYRLSVALAFLENPEIIVIDNFCEPLDRYTSVAVIRGLKSLAKEAGVAVLAATAAYDRNYIMSLADQTVMLRRGDRPIVRRREVAH